MDGYRQTLLGRALADALQDIEKELSGDNSDANTAVLEMDGDLLFSLFDEAMQLELLDKRCKDQEKPIKTFTHDSLELTGQVTAFNRFMDDWSVLVRMRSQDIELNHVVAVLDLPEQRHQHEEEQYSIIGRFTVCQLLWTNLLLLPVANCQHAVLDDQEFGAQGCGGPTLTRGMAAAASSTKEVEEIGGFGQMTQPKLQLFGLHARYANALYSVAAKQNQLESVEKELLTIEETIAKEPNFASFLHDPTIARASKKEDIAKVMEKAKFSKPVAGLFEVLADNGRLPDAAGVISAFKKLMGAYRGEVQAKVTSADPLTKTSWTRSRRPSVLVWRRTRSCCWKRSWTRRSWAALRCRSATTSLTCRSLPRSTRSTHCLPTRASSKTVFRQAGSRVNVV
ncbi:F1F0 ATP synthase OSCP/delta subunit, N-terminal domain [Phytophthora cactorum]|nr:F1F0 ATP synthase OSCP/delta subunit, N-terminal domain [Phytophthora cactorum]